MRYLIICLAALLSCGVVEAGAKDADCLRAGSDGTVYNICKMPDLSKILDFDVSPLPQELVTCDQDMTKCETPCEKKMREAMKIAQKYMYSPDGAFTTEYCDAVCKAERELERVKQEQTDLRKWDAVMQECVR